ncbi:MAG: hypothetical protein Q8L54_14915 [Devosia sp.]|nr:hypothetical protein [Devosia sp.]
MRQFILAFILLFPLAHPVLAAGAEDKARLKVSAGQIVDLEAMFRERHPRTLAILQADFPSDLEALIEKFAAIEKEGGGRHAMAARLFGEMSGLRRKYAEKLLFSPNPSLAKLLLRLADFYDQVLRAAGADVCGRFAQDGAGLLFDLGLSETFGETLDLQSEAFFDAVVRAIETPEYHGPASSADWSVVMGAMIGLGGPPSYIATISAGDRNDPDLCPAQAAMFRASAVLTTPEGERTRADLAKNLTGY